jgi:hypothetical protein
MAAHTLLLGGNLHPYVRVSPNLAALATSYPRFDMAQQAELWANVGGRRLALGAAAPARWGTAQHT